MHVFTIGTLDLTFDFSVTLKNKLGLPNSNKSSYQICEPKLEAPIPFLFNPG